MIVGVPKEVKPGEQRVALTPAGTHALREQGQRVLVQREAGIGSGIRDAEFVKAGAELTSWDQVWA
ncbi:MAG: alanine dehydrogenase, partial [Candidatus Rokuibacteriota bacterium]